MWSEDPSEQEYFRALYARGEITADDAELVLARYAKKEEKEPLQSVLNASVENITKLSETKKPSAS